jgi:hypothetical protein
MVKLSEATTGDELRGKLIKPLLQIMANERAAAESYIKAVVTGQQTNAWGAQAQDLQKRSDTLSLAVNEGQASIRVDLAALEAASEKIREYLPAELRYDLGLAQRPSPFRLGCDVFVRNPFYLLVVSTDGLGYKLGLRAGDMIRSAGDREFTAKDSLEDFKLIILQNLGKTLNVVVDRDGKRKTLPLKIPKEIPAKELYIT